MKIKFFLIIVLVMVTTSLFAANELINYVNKIDDSYSYKMSKLQVTSDQSVSISTIDLVSQKWQGVELKHKVQLFYPSNALITDTALLVNTGGDPSDDWTQIGAYVAKIMACPIVVVYNIPNQPMWDKSEDALITYTFQKAFEAKDYSEWPLLLTTTKSVIKSMDAIEDLTKEKYDNPIEKFIVTGASKRGWTTWLVAATGDKRVTGIAPIVFDFLDFKSQLKHQKEYYNDTLSNSLSDYTNSKFDEAVNTPEGEALLSVVDPFSYIDNIKIPKLIINGTNDSYWTLDSSSLYFDKLKGDSYLWYSVNGGHELGFSEGSKSSGLTKMIPLISVMRAFVYKVAMDKNMDSFKWNWEKSDDNIKCVIDVDPLKVVEAYYYVAENETMDFRNVTWKQVKLEKKDDKYEFSSVVSKKGHRAGFIELKFNSVVGGTYSLFTTPYIFN